MEKINVPELFYLHHLSKLPNGTSTLLQKLEGTTPTSRGRGKTRVIEVDATERAELLALAEQFGVLTGIPSEERETTLRGAICAQALAKRLRGEKPVKKVKDTTPEPETQDVQGETTEEPSGETEEDFMINLGDEPPTVEESEEDDIMSMYQDLQLGSQ